MADDRGQMTEDPTSPNGFGATSRGKLIRIDRMKIFFGIMKFHTRLSKAKPSFEILRLDILRFCGSLFSAICSLSSVLCHLFSVICSLSSVF